MHFGFTLDSSDKDLWNIDLLGAHLDLLDTDNSSKHFVCFQDVLQASSRHVFKASSRHVFKTSSRHIFKTSSRYVFMPSWRHLQRNNFLSSKASLRRLQEASSGRLVLVRCLQGVFARHLEDVLEDEKLLRWRRNWRRLEDVLKTNKCLLGYKVFLVFFT